MVRCWESQGCGGTNGPIRLTTYVVGAIEQATPSSGHVKLTDGPSQDDQIAGQRKGEHRGKIGTPGYDGVSCS